MAGPVPATEQMPSRLTMLAPVIPFALLWLFKPLLPSWAIVPPKSCLGGCGTIEGLIPFVDWVNAGIKFLRSYETVSYTHLTLPTILPV